MTKFILTLTENYETKTYRLTEDMFMDLSVKLEPYRSVSIPAKPVRCIETGEIYESAMCASKQLNLHPSYSNAEKIKKVCKGRGRKEEAFGYHWQYVNETDRKAGSEKVQKIERHRHYAVLKNSNNSRSYKISAKLFSELSKYLKPYHTTPDSYIKPVKCIETGEIFPSASEAAKKTMLIKELYDCNPELIKQACRGNSKTSYGYHWEYADKETALK